MTRLKTRAVVALAVAVLIAVSGAIALYLLEKRARQLQCDPLQTLDSPSAYFQCVYARRKL